MITSTSVVVRMLDDELQNFPCASFSRVAWQFEYACSVVGVQLTTGQPTVYQVFSKGPVKHVSVGSASDSVSILQRFLPSRLRDAVGLRLRRRFKPSYEWWSNSTSRLAGSLCDEPSRVSLLQDELYVCGSSDACLKNLCDFYELLELLLPRMSGVSVGQLLPSDLIDEGVCLDWMRALTGLLSSLDVEFYHLQGWRATKESRHECPLTKKYERSHASFARYLAKTVFVLSTACECSAISWQAMENWRNWYLSAVRSLLLAQVVMSLDVTPCDGISDSQSSLDVSSLLALCEERNLHA